MFWDEFVVNKRFFDKRCGFNFFPAKWYGENELKRSFPPAEVEYRWCQFWSKVITPEVEERPKLVTANYGRHRSQWVKSKTGKQPTKYSFSFISLLCTGKFSQTSTIHLGIFPGWALWTDSVSPWMNTIVSCDQLKPIRIGTKLVMNYNSLQCPSEERGSPILFSWRVNGHFCFAWSVNEDLFFPWFMNLYVLSLGNWFLIFLWSVKCAFTFAWFVNQRRLQE